MEAHADSGLSGSRMAGTVFGAALLVRLAVLAQLQGSVLVTVLLGDGAFFDRRAREIVAGGLLAQEVFYQAPLYAYVVALLYALFGAHVLVVQVAQAIFGAATCALVALASRRLLGRGAGWAAGGLLVLYAPAVWLDGLIQKASLALLLTTTILWLAASPRAARPARAALLGVVLGLLVLTRENTVVLWPVLAAWVATRAPRGAWSRARPALILTAGFALPFGPPLAHNLIVGREFIPSSSSVGVNFYLGNRTGADGLYTTLVPGQEHPDHESIDARRLAERASGRSLTALQVSRYWLERGLQDVRDDPWRWLGLVGRKALLVLNRRELMDADSLEASREVAGLLDLLARCVHFGVLLPLAAVGAWAARARWRELWLLPAAALALGLGISLFFVTARFRMGLVPFLAPLAGAGILELVALARARSARRAAPALLLIAGTALIAVLPTTRPPFSLRGDPRATTWTNVSTALLGKGQAEGARDFARRALELEPTSADALFNLALALVALGLADEARAHLREAAELEPRYSADVEIQLGLLQAQAGAPELAVLHFQRAIAFDPEKAEAHYDLGLALRQSGLVEQAIPAYQAALSLRPDWAEAEGNLAFAYEVLGQTHAAVAHDLRALELDRDHLPSLRRLAWTLATHPAAELRDGEEALRLARHGLALAGGGDPGLRHALAAAQAELGRFEEAALTTEALLAEAPSEEERAVLRARLDLYRSHSPFRDSP